MAPSQAVGAPEGERDPYATRFASTLENWKRKLLDITKRNRALNFKPTRVSTISVVDELPTEIFRLLYINERSMRFKAAPEGTGTPDCSLGDEQGDRFQGDFEFEELPSQDFVPYDAVVLGERHTDEWLQTSLDPEHLDRSLRRIDEQARSTVEEQGVNTLFLALGMLHYGESTDSEVVLRAPLVLVPAHLSRKTARAGYTVAAGDEDAIANPALMEYLRLSFGIKLPELPDASSLPDDYDLQTFFTAVADGIATQKGWAVKSEVHLGLFSFQKFVMFKDLEANAAAIQAHRLIRQLLSRTGPTVVGLPSDIRDLDLDTAFTPESTFQVVDADSSQTRAAAAVARGHDLVIEGPPGTGKSQTITNLIAQSLAVDKTVLFVAEKMAALDVVHRRLNAAGLGEFCLALHSGKANKRLVLKDLATTLDLSMQPVAGTTTAKDRLPVVRATLNEYVRSVHEPFGAIAMTPYRAYGELGLVLDTPRLVLEIDVEKITLAQFDEAFRALENLAVHASHVGDVSVHPWRDTTKSLYTPDDLEVVTELAGRVATRAKQLLDEGVVGAEKFGVPPIKKCSDAYMLPAVAELLAESPGAPIEVLQSASWDGAPPKSVELIESGRRLSRIIGELDPIVLPAAFDHDHADDINYVEDKTSGLFGWLAFLDSRYRSTRKRWTSYWKPGVTASTVEKAGTLKKVEQVRHMQEELRRQAHGKDLFGSLWQADRSDWDCLERYVEWVVRFRACVVRHKLSLQASVVSANSRPDVGFLHDLYVTAKTLQREVGCLEQLVGWPAAYLSTLDLEEVIVRSKSLAAAPSLGGTWAAFHDARTDAQVTAAREIVKAASEGRVRFDQAPLAFKRAFYMRLVGRMVDARPPLKHFHTISHEGRIEEFRNLDQTVLRQNQAALIGTLRDRTQQRLQEGPAVAGLAHLRKEMVRQRGISPLRRTFRQCEATITAMKPCLLMSPLTVAQYLSGALPTYDLVIFDEASQLPTEDAIGAIVRGKQLVVVGDPKQLPPTNFFAVSSTNIQVPLGEDGTPIYEDTESVLEEFMGAAVPMSRLRWHYRSTHESLITFSNISFYDADLHTFPSVATGASAGLQFCLVAGGVYEGKGVNMLEARRVADEVVAFAKEQLLQVSKGDEPFSLGVGTFNLRQQLAIQDELEIRRRDDPSIEPFFDRTRREPFFVKNLENIQGDERDCIVLSVTYGKGSDGRLRYNFGPLNRENGWRRLNVLTTRARHEMRVFSSMSASDINLQATATDGPRLLRDFLAYAEHRRLDSPTVSSAAATESPFERDVYNELTRRGVRVVPQVGSSGYRVDLAVLDDELPGQFVCAIECDGVAYHSLETARDRDRLRQQVLESRGWQIGRVWSTDWFKDRPGQIERLLSFVKDAQGNAREQREKRRGQARVALDHDPPQLTSGRGAPGPIPQPSKPTALAYQFCPGEGRHSRTDILEVEPAVLLDVVKRVVEVEAPLHEDDLVTRVAGMWSKKAGTRIRERVLSVARFASRQGVLVVRGEFYWFPNQACVVRSRADTQIPGNRIAPEEITAAISRVLDYGRSHARATLINEVRALFGYNRTGAILDEAIGRVVDEMLERGQLGQGSSGLVLRVTPL